MQKLIVVVTGGQSEESTTNRLGEGLASAVVDEGRSVGADVRVETISVRDLAHEIASASVTGFATGDLQTAIDLVGEADAVIAVSPTYRASYTGLFKAFWDVTPDGIIAGVPMIVGATGGTPRHSLVTDTALRPLFAYLKALVMPTAVYAAADDWAGGSLTSRMREAAVELAAQIFGSAGAAESVPQSSHDDATDAHEPDAEPAAPRSAHAPRTLGATRARAKDPFENVPTMEAMLRR